MEKKKMEKYAIGYLERNSQIRKEKKHVFWGGVMGLGKHMAEKEHMRGKTGRGGGRLNTREGELTISRKKLYRKFEFEKNKECMCRDNKTTEGKKKDTIIFQKIEK